MEDITSSEYSLAYAGAQATLVVVAAQAPSSIEVAVLFLDSRAMYVVLWCLSHTSQLHTEHNKNSNSPTKQLIRFTASDNKMIARSSGTLIHTPLHPRTHTMYIYLYFPYSIRHSLKLNAPKHFNEAIVYFEIWI